MCLNTKDTYFQQLYPQEKNIPIYAILYISPAALHCGVAYQAGEGGGDW